MVRAHTGINLTQGTIFSCAVAEGYSDCKVHGLVITARCDLAHDKAPIFNYLPIVRLDDWLHRDFLSHMCNRAESDTQQQFLNFLKNHSIADSVLIAHSPAKIVDAFFPQGNPNPATQKARDKGQEIVQKLGVLADARSKPCPEATKKVSQAYTKLRERLIKDCVHQQLAGYYFLPLVSPGEKPLGHVVLMREVHHLPRAIAQRLAVGLPASEYRGLGSSSDCSLNLVPDDLAFCVGQLSSPALEHLLQTFTLLFSRIGMPDPDPDYVAGLWAPSQVSKEQNNEVHLP